MIYVSSMLSPYPFQLLTTLLASYPLHLQSDEKCVFLAKSARQFTEYIENYQLQMLELLKSERIILYKIFPL